MSKKKLKLTTPKVTVVHYDGDETQGKQLWKTVSCTFSIVTEHVSIPVELDVSIFNNAQTNPVMSIQVNDKHMFRDSLNDGLDLETAIRRLKSLQFITVDHRDFFDELKHCEPTNSYIVITRKSGTVFCCGRFVGTDPDRVTMPIVAVDGTDANIVPPALIMYLYKTMNK